MSYQTYLLHVPWLIVRSAVALQHSRLLPNHVSQPLSAHIYWHLSSPLNVEKTLSSTNFKGLFRIGSYDLWAYHGSPANRPSFADGCEAKEVCTSFQKDLFDALLTMSRLEISYHLPKWRCWFSGLLRPQQRQRGRLSSSSGHTFAW